MVTIPDTGLSEYDVDRLADWVELKCLLRASGEVSRSDVADVLHNSLELEAGDDQRELTPQDLAQEWADDILAEVRHRRRSLGEGYPLRVAKDVVQTRGSWEDTICYTALLIADMGRFYKSVQTKYDPASPFTRLFESVVQAGLSLVLGGTSVRFGVPRDPDWPTDIFSRLRRLAEEMGVETDEPEKKAEPTDGDIGLDVVTRIRLGDEGAGTGIVLTQCATGTNFMGKRGEPALMEWADLIYWKSHVIRGMAFPWRRDISERRFGRLAKRFEAIFFDRMRLFSSGNPDPELRDWVRDELRDWCVQRIAEFPNA